MKDSLYIIMPAYNEEDSLPTVLDQWYPLVEAHPDSRLVCFNDGSKDQTWAVLQEYEKTHPKLIAFNNRNQGHGATIYEGYQYAVNSNVDYVFQTDSDGQTDPSEFALFWDAIHDTNEGGVRCNHRA